MRPYETKKLTEFPDIGDIRCEGRKSTVGRFDDKSYTRSPRVRKAIRRSLKRADKAKNKISFD